MHVPSRLLLAAVSLFGLPVRATWYSENVANGSDIIQMDLRWPWWPSGSYFANWNSSFNPKPNNLSFYAGFLGTVPDGPDQTPNPDEAVQAAFRPGSVWTFWGADAAGTPVRFVDVAPNLFIKNDYGGEGSSGTTGAEPWPFMRAGRWYTMLGRVWRTAPDADHGFIGRWIKDHADGRWHLIGIARLPIPVTSFTSNAGFLEPLGSEKAVRSLHRRLGYFRKDGAWGKSDTIAIDKTQYVVVNTVGEGEHEYAAIEYAQRPDHLPLRLKGLPLAGDQKHSFTVRQPDQPALDRPALGAVNAQGTDHQVAVTWQVPDTAAPMLGYQIEAFAASDATGTPLAVKEERNPSARQALLDLPARAGSVRVRLTDIYDQVTEPVTAAVAPQTLRPAAPDAEPTQPGLAYELFHKDGRRQVNHFYDPIQNPKEEHHWLNLEELSQGVSVRSGLSRGFDSSVREQRSSGYALVYRGRLRVPADGLYLLRARIDNAYRIRVGGEEVLMWDGPHGTTERSAVRAWAKGDHELEVTHLVDQPPAKNFLLEWEGPGLPRQFIPLEALRVADNGAAPRPVLTGSAGGDGTGSLNVEVDPRGHTVDRTVLFLGALQLAEAKGPLVTFSGPLPRGPNTLWSRVVFDRTHTVDSAPLTLDVTGKPVDPSWTVRNVGDTKASAGLWQAGSEAFRFFGNGMHTVTRQMEGDFTATCRVDEYNGSKGEPVNRRAWVGLTAREHGERINWEWGRDFHLVQTAADGLRSSADSTDYGGGRISSYALPAGRPWLRIARAGDVWTAWTSVDGRAWELGAHQYKRMAAKVDVGLFFSALPQDARAHYHADVSAFSLQPGVAPECVLPDPPVATGTGGERWTGVVMARSDARVVVVRSTSSGLVRSTDGGANWAPANGTLAGDDLCVRSVAVHPEDARTLLRACGRGADGRLWKSTDGGQTWSRLDFPGDFDGAGPSALCGEVLAYDLKDSRIVYAGTESRGFFKSTDGGATWVQLGLVGERVTAVAVWPWEKHYPAPAKGKSQIAVTTCPDAWMRHLGRGEPVVKTPARVSRGHVSRDGIQTLVVAEERADTGFYNFAFDKALMSVGEMRYATTHGIQAQVFEGWHMATYAEWKHLDWQRPVTGIGAVARGDHKFGWCITQALNPVRPGRVSRSERWAYEWSWLEQAGDLPAGGLIAAAGDVHLGDRWWFLHTDGLYGSTDSGRTLKRVVLP